MPALFFTVLTKYLLKCYMAIILGNLKWMHGVILYILCLFSEVQNEASDIYHDYISNSEDVIFSPRPHTETYMSRSLLIQHLKDAFVITVKM